MTDSKFTTIKEYRQKHIGNMSQEDTKKSREKFSLLRREQCAAYLKRKKERMERTDIPEAQSYLQKWKRKREQINHIDLFEAQSCLKKWDGWDFTKPD